MRYEARRVVYNVSNLNYLFGSETMLYDTTPCNDRYVYSILSFRIVAQDMEGKA